MDAIFDRFLTKGRRAEFNGVYYADACYPDVETGAPVPTSRPPRDGEYSQFDNEPEFGLIKYVTMLA